MPLEVKAMKEKELEDLRSKAKSRELSERERSTVLRYKMLKFLGKSLSLFCFVYSF